MSCDVSINSPAPDRHRHRLLRQPGAPQPAAAPAARPRRAVGRAGRRHHRRAGVRPHPGRRRRQDAALRRERAGRHRPRAAAAARAAVGRAQRCRPGAGAAGRDLGTRATLIGRTRRRRLAGGAAADLCVIDPSARMAGRRRCAAQPGQAHALHRLCDCRAARLHAGGRPGRARDYRRRLTPCVRSARCWKLMRAVAHMVGGWWTIRFRSLAKPRPKRDARVQQWAERMLAIVGVRLEVQGTPPRQGRPGGVQPPLVARHRGRPRRAPRALRLQGRRAPLAGGRHAGRGRRHALHRTREPARRVACGASHGRGPAQRRHRAVFPEGTTSDGRGVLPFHANLLQAAIVSGAPVLPAALRFADAATGETSPARSTWATTAWSVRCGAR